MRALMVFLLGAFCMVQSAVAVGVATVVRAHPWLTRGLERESLVGVRFADAWGGALDKLSFKVTFKHCSAADVTDYRLWIQPRTKWVRRVARVSLREV